MSVTTLSNVPDIVARSIAQNIADTATKLSIPSPVDYLQDVISEVMVQTQIMGSALLTLILIDPDWQIQRSGLCDVNSDGLLQQVDVNYPVDSDVWWRLAMVEGTSDLTGPNLTLTFQHRLVAYLTDDWGHLSVAPKTKTRAQFIKQLADRIPKSISGPDRRPPILGPGGPDSQRIKFVCPELNQVQPLAFSAGTGSSGTSLSATKHKTVVTKATAASGLSKANKTSGKAWKVIASAESDPPGALGACRTIQTDGYSELSTDPLAPSLDFAALGGIPCLTPLRITNPANGKSVTTVKQDKGAGSTFNGPSSGYPVMGIYPGTQAALGLSGGQLTVVIQRADGGALAPVRGTEVSGSAISAGGTGGGTSSRQVSDVTHLTRGTAENPDEDSWQCMQRLAAEVNWSLFTDPHPAPGVWGNFLYYMTGPDMDAQKPSFYMELDDTGTAWSATSDDGSRSTIVGEDGVISSLHYTFDNSAFIYKATKKRKGKIQRKTRIQHPQSPSQVSFNMIVEYPMQWSAGQVIIFNQAGPLNGRWIVSDVTHNTLADSFAQFTLVPPTEPNPEPTTTITGSGGGVTVKGGAFTLKGGATNPAPGAVWSRLDMGFDGNYGPAGAVAPFNGTIHGIGIGGWPGQGQYFAVLNDDQSGPDYTRCMYFAEGATPLFQNGAKVTAGQKIGNPVASGGNGSPGNFEIGPASTDNFDCLAKKYGLHSAGARTMVLAFATWLQSLGASASSNPSAAGGP